MPNWRWDMVWLPQATAREAYLESSITCGLENRQENFQCFKTHVLFFIIIWTILMLIQSQSCSSQIGSEPNRIIDSKVFPTKYSAFTLTQTWEFKKSMSYFGFRWIYSLLSLKFTGYFKLREKRPKKKRKHPPIKSFTAQHI